MQGNGTGSQSMQPDGDLDIKWNKFGLHSLYLMKAVKIHVNTGDKAMTVERCVVCSEGLKENTNAAHRAIKWFGGNKPWPLGAGPDKPEGRACDLCNDAVEAARILNMHFGD